MRGKHKAHLVVRLFWPFIFLAGFFVTDLYGDPNESTKYLDAVREFADNVLKYGRDTYGPKHTPLFVDGLNIHTHEPVKWISPKGEDPLTATETEEWILSNFASQQTLLRTLDGLSEITGDAKYRQAAMDSIKYAFENLRRPSGLFYWGHAAAYDASKDQVWGSMHCLKLDYPHYELMWKADPKATKKFIEAYWSAHIMDWSNLDFNRIGRIGIRSTNFEDPWNHEYEGGPTFFKSKHGGGGFFTTGTSLVHAGTMLYALSGQDQPLVWSKRLVGRYIATRHPNTGISAYQYNNPWRSLGDDFKEHFADPYTTIFPLEPFEETRGIYYPETVQTHAWISLLLVGDTLGEEGKQFTQWAVEELTSWGKASYRKEDNSFVPMLTDGTTIEGYVCKQDSALGPRGSIAKPYYADSAFFWAYTIAYRTSRDEFIWQMVRNIGLGNDFGDIGESPKHKAKLKVDTTCSDVFGLVGFLELYNSINKPELLQIARRIGDNIVQNHFFKGFFVPTKKHTYTRFDSFEPLALLHLYTAMESKKGIVPHIWPSSPLFVPPYRYKEKPIDRRLIYRLTELSEPPMSLQEAAAIGDIDLIRSLVKKGIEIDEREDPLYKTALHRAAISGHKDVAELLIARGADVDAKSSGLNTPLHYAIQEGHKEMAELLIGNGADVNAKNNQGQSPLDIAMSRNRKDIVELLLRKGAEISSIHIAAQVGDLARVSALLRQGADVNAQDNKGITPLNYAVQGGQKDLVEFLIAKGADVNGKDKRGYTPFHYAIWYSKTDIARLLIEKGAEIHAKDQSGYTPLHWAVMMGNRELSELLLTKGADPNAQGKAGETPLDFAFYVGEAIGQLLVEKGAEVSSLQSAAFIGDLNKVKAFISKGADINKPNVFGVTALHVAASGGHKDIVEFLIVKGADINTSVMDGQTPLHWAADKGHRDIVELLVAKGAEVNAKDKRGRTPLSLAKQRGHTEIVELLRKHMLSHDVAFTNVSVPFTCTQGDIVPITVSIANEGHQREAFRVILVDVVSSEQIAGREMTLEPQKYRSANAADLILSPTSSGQGNFGWGININGDINQDDYDDLLIGASLWNENRGRAYLYFGGADMDGIPDLIFAGEAAGDFLGDGAVALGDVNGDGYDDVIIGARGYNNNDGRLYIFFGDIDMDGEDDVVLDGEPRKTGYFSCNCLSVGDVDKDGYVDVLVGSCGYDKGRGRVYLYYGGDPMDSSADVVFEGERADDSFGRNATIGQDIDGDGYRDILIGARTAPEGTRNGRAYLFYGGDRNQMDAVCDMTFTPPIGRPCEFGSSLDIYDIDSDGHADVVIGARLGQGAVFVYWGNKRDKMDAVADATIFGEDGAQSSLGGDKLFCADFNRDGYGDIAVGAYNWIQQNRIGRTYIYYGGTKTSIDTQPDVIFTGETEGSWFGHHIGGGDFNNDGYTDLVAGAWGYNNKEGRAYVFYAPFEDKTDITFKWDTTNASIGKHTLTARIAPVEGEKDTADNTMTVEVEVRARSRSGPYP